MLLVKTLFAIQQLSFCVYSGVKLNIRACLVICRLLACFEEIYILEEFQDVMSCLRSVFFTMTPDYNTDITGNCAGFIVKLHL